MAADTATSKTINQTTILMKILHSTPISLSSKVYSSRYEVPDYNWVTQSRYDRNTITNATTFSTKQTFDRKGLPCDNTSDQD
jgi:hypothetical protein